FLLIFTMHVMLPLRFLNNGIRAKAGRRRGGQPRPTPMHGRPPTAKPRQRSPTRGRLATARANPKGRPTAPTRGGSRPQGQCLWAEASPACTANCGQPVWVAAACSVAPAKGAGCKAPARGCCPWPALPPAGATAPAVGAAASGQGQPPPA
ncbi:hypothetical protein BHM03_00014569, partial [Ensete ventricosum]